jgi:bacteriorhodopsin
MTLVTTISALTYFLMATGQGVTFKETTIRHSNDHVPDTYEHLKRQVFWVRFVEWTLINPLLLINLGILSGLSGAHILMAVVANIIMNLMGLFAAFGDEGTPQKWGNYVIAILAFLVVVWHLAVNGRGQVQAKSQKVASFYYAIAIYTIIVWAAYAV